MEYRLDPREVSELHAPGNDVRDGSYAERVARSMKLRVTHCDEDEVEFDLEGVDASFANALRRIMLSEVPTMAIESVYIEENDGVVQDEVLAHRLGLVPIAADPADFEDLHAPEDATDANTIVFGLEVRAPPNSRASKVPSARVADRVPGEPAPHQDDPPDDAPGGPRHTTKVMSGDLGWLPQGEQEAFLADRPVRPVHDDILLAKLRPGQAISLEAHGRKGIGKDHAKFSPVATASYRMRPRLDVAEGPAAAPFAPRDHGFPKEIKSRPAPCELCKVCAPLADKAPPYVAAFERRVTLKREGTSFLFKVESAGQLAPLRILRDAIAILRAKCDTWQRELELNDGAVAPE